ncbi:MAG: VCBS repeat-containing protein [Planctomycetes bacterium]|nr:VCBS repeat-containing protein [Planctomycetota bacterium]
MATLKSLPRGAVWTAGLVLGLATSSGARDCNGNGAPDRDDVASGASEDCNSDGLPDECEGEPLPYTSRSALPLPGSPRALATEDLDMDGLLDVAVGHGDGLSRGGVSVLLNRGAGELARDDYEAAEPMSSLAAGDLDGDGDRDIALVDSRALRVLWNDGGRFGGPLAVETPRRLRALAAGDLDADGSEDAVATDLEGDSVWVFFARGGGFEPPREHAAGRSPIGLELADLDSDGDLDVATANRLSEDVALLLNDGSGDFAPAARVPLRGGAPQGILAADLGADDGRPDLAVPVETGVEVLAGQGGGGFRFASSFALEAAILEPGVSGLAAADLQGDGRLDLALGSYSVREVTALLGKGDRSFRSAATLSLDGVPRGLAAGDIDGDGDPEIVAVTSRQDVALLWNDRSGSPASVSFLRRGFAIPHEPHALALADLDGDSAADAAAATGTWGSLAVLRNDGSGGLGHLKTYPLAPNGGLESIAPVDLDRDGRLDLVAADAGSSRLRVLRNAGEAAFAAAGSLSVGIRPVFVAAGDLDRDGAGDVLSVNQGADSVSVLLNAGDGKLGPERAVRVGAGPISAALGDLDSDGDLDAAVANESSSSASILLGDGAGGFPRRADIDVARPGSIAAADLDADGRRDIAVASAAQGGVLILRNQGGGGFEPARIVPVGQPLNSLAAGDLNGDGRADLVGADFTQSRLWVLLHEAGLKYRPPASFPTGNGPRAVVLGDLNGDGSLDLVTADHAARQVEVHANLTPGGFAGPYLERVCTPSDFHKVSVPAPEGGEVVRLTKYLAPADPADGSLLPTLFQNARRFPLHQELLAAQFPDRFPALDLEAYARLVGQRATRKYFVGSISRLAASEEPLFGFDVLADYLSDPRERPTRDEVRGVYLSLAAAFTLRPLAYAPGDRLAREDVARWRDPGFPVHLGRTAGEADYRAYSLGVGYGRARILDPQAFAEANARGRIGFQDVLVLEGAPRDIEGVVAGVITAEPQGELSHLAVRTARRGTPNAFAARALETFAPLEGKLVRLEVRPDGFGAQEATPEEARAWWEANRPQLSTPPSVDEAYAALDGLEEMDLSGTVAPPEARYGGKAANLARLQAILTGPFEAYRERGFAVPVRYYLEFLRGNRIPSALDPERQVTYEDFLGELAGWPDFQSDPELRFEVLRRFREWAQERGEVPRGLVGRLWRRIEEVFGDAEVLVRFRSSSNVEDALELNGAGLYDSTSACAADDVDANASGPSICDPSRADEIGIARALRRVWASLWNFRAYEERAFYGVPQERTAMAVLVTRAFLDERANGVAFTGNPANPLDRRYLVIAQAGEASVVSPEPGVTAEKDLLEVEDGRVVRVVRAERSSLLPPGDFVLSEAELEELGRVLGHIDRNFPIDLGGRRREDALLDIELKVEADGSLAVKQVRPFLRGSSAALAPTFELVVPQGTVACGTFVELRPPREAYELKSTVRFAPGRIALPAASEAFSAALFEEVRLGPERELASPLEPGTFRVTATPGEGGIATYRFRYQQRFELPGGAPFDLELTDLSFRARGAEPLEPARLLDEERLASEVTLQGVGERIVRYSSCGHEGLPLWVIAVRTEDGSAFVLEERFEPPGGIALTGPAALVRARVSLRGLEREVSDYWHLVYSAGRHNLNVRYWVLLDPPLEVPGLGRPVRAVEIVAPEPRLGVEARVSYLDQSFETIASSAVLAFARTADDEPSGERFRRGDANADGGVDLSDAVTVLEHLFRGGAPPVCLKAADADDDGALSLRDAIAVLLHLFAGAGPLPEPSGACGADPTRDGLRCESQPGCW